jgi:hypothetical protein
MVIVWAGLLFILFGILAFQDIRFRLVSGWIFLLVFIVSLFYKDLSMWSEMCQLLINIILIAVLFLFLFLFYFFKNGKIWFNLFNEKIGIGDLLFLIAISPLFSLFNFIGFLIASQIFALIAHVIFCKTSLKYKSHQTVALAGLMAIPLMALIVSEVIFEKDYSRHNMMIETYLIQNMIL